MTIFNIYRNNKCFLSIKTAYYYDFWRSCDTEVWSNDTKNSALHHRNKLHFKIYTNWNQFIYICTIFHNVTDFFYQINAALVNIREKYTIGLQSTAMHCLSVWVLFTVKKNNYIYIYIYIYINERCIYIALYCVLLYTQSTLQSCGRGGGGGLSSTTTSVQHPLGWCNDSHRTTAPVRSPER